MTSPTRPDRNENPERSTPGRPRDTSRQQKHGDQNVQSGSESLDRPPAGEKASERHPKPPGAK